ncbi:MAG: hypothetical protein KF914_12640 [Rhizobiaceae bacterium]|nr:hypothetical protein [Rhizobiaceae bacterium]
MANGNTSLARATPFDDPYIASLTGFLTAVRHSNVDDPVIFSQMLFAAIDKYKVRQADIAAHLRVTTGTVGRWAAGSHRPNSATKRVVRVFIEGAVTAQIEALR